jgi:hypothetical protein
LPVAILRLQSNSTVFPFYAVGADVFEKHRLSSFVKILIADTMEPIDLSKIEDFVTEPRDPDDRFCRRLPYQMTVLYLLGMLSWIPAAAVEL